MVLNEDIVVVTSGLRWAPHTFSCIYFWTKSNSIWGWRSRCLHKFSLSNNYMSSLRTTTYDALIVPSDNTSTYQQQPVAAPCSAAARHVRPCPSPSPPAGRPSGGWNASPPDVETSHTPHSHLSSGGLITEARHNSLMLRSFLINLRANAFMQYSNLQHNYVFT